MNRRSLLTNLIGPIRTYAADTSPGEPLIVIFLRGGCDALSLLPPMIAEDRKIYEEERPYIKTPTNLILPLDERIGLHPSAARFHDLYKEKKLAVFTAAGVKSNNRSHFDAQAFMELGTPDRKSTTSGWLARHLENTSGGASAEALGSVAMGSMTPTSLLGSGSTTAILQPKRFSSLGGDKDVQADMAHTLRSMYTGTNTLAEKGRSAVSVIELLGHTNFTDYTPGAGVEYPKGEIANHLKTLAQLMRMKMGIQIATVDMGGWDTHKYQGQGTDGTFAKQVDQLSSAVHAFHKDLELDANVRKPTIVIMSEFGRRLRENANRGTDHGHGGMMMVLGPEVKGGKVYGQWPGLKTEQLYERADLAVTTDFRQVLAEILVRRRKERQLAKVFPEFRLEKDLDFIKPA